MKKKKLLCTVFMAALAFATTNTFVSCKDYDDDISDLRTEIGKLATADELSSKVSEMQTAIAAAQSAAEAKAAAAQQVADAAKAAATDAASAAAAAQAKADELEKNGATKDEVDAARKAADAAQAAADKAAKDATDAIAQVKADLQEAAEAAATAVQTAQAAADKAQADATSALEKIAELEKNGATKAEVEAAKSDAAAAQATADKAVEDAKAAKDAADAAKAAADKAQTTADAAVASIDAVIAGVDTEKVNLKSLDAEIAGIKALLNLAGLEGAVIDLSDLSKRVTALDEKLKDIIGEYTTMVTDVSLYIGNAADEYRHGIPMDNMLNFIFLDQEKTTKFPAEDGIANAQIEFSDANKNVTTTDSVVVRVSPVNATLAPSNISLINSQGVELSDYVEVASVKPYSKLMTGDVRTRAAEGGNGLWMVTFKVKDGIDAEKLAEAVEVKRGEFSYGVKFAVAVKNTASADTRRVVSAYDLEVLPADYEPAKEEILVQDANGVWKEISNVRNRWYRESSTKYFAWADNGQKSKANVAEYAWDATTGPQIAGVETGKVLAPETESRTKWGRYTAPLLEVAVGQDININVASVLGGDGKPSNNDNPAGGTVSQYNKSNYNGYAVKGFYVTLDKEAFAVESSPSEWNAWNTYEYTNVGTSKQKATLFTGKEGYISINSESAKNNDGGDIIGFRVYVVNLDGTLVDPDGRAFYVRVGRENQGSMELTTAADVTAKLQKKQAWNTDGEGAKANGEDADYYNPFISAKAELAAGALDGTDYEDVNDNMFGYRNETGLIVKHEWIFDANPAAYGNNKVEPTNSDFKLVWLDKNEKKTTKIEDIKYVQVELADPTKFLDGGEYKIRTNLLDENDEVVRTLTLTFKKEMPTEAPTLAWNTTYFDPTKQVFTNTNGGADIYKIAEGDNPQAIKLADKLKDFNLGRNDSRSHYKLFFEGVGKYADATTNPDSIAPVPNNYSYDITSETNDAVDKVGNSTNGYNWAYDEYTLSVGQKDVNAKAHSISYKYDFGRISLVYNTNTGSYTAGDYLLAGKNKLNLTFNSWSHFENINWDSAPTLNFVEGGTTTPTTINLYQVNKDKSVDVVLANDYVVGKLTSKVTKYTKIDGTIEYSVKFSSTYGGVNETLQVTGITLDEDGYVTNSYNEATGEYAGIEIGAPYTAPENKDLLKAPETLKRMTESVEVAPYALKAYNTVLNNFLDTEGKTVFGKEKDKVFLWDLLANDYLNFGVKPFIPGAAGGTMVPCEFEPAGLYEVELNALSLELVFKQTGKTTTQTKGVVTIKVYDCFNVEKEIKLNVNIED